MAGVAGAAVVLVGGAAWYSRGVEVTVISDPPGTTVAVDGNFVGMTDGRAGGISIPNLAHGNHILQLSHPGFDAYRQSISLGFFSSSRQMSIKLSVESFPLTVLTDPPGASVQIDGRQLGVSDSSGNVVLQKVPLGRHVITVTRESFPPWSRSLVVGSPLTIRADLRALAAAAEQEIVNRLSSARLLAQQGQPQAALAEIEAILRLAPANPQALGLKSEIEKAAAAQAEAATRREIASRLTHAQQLFQQRQYQSAISECDAILRISPTNTQATSLRSQIQETMKILGH